MSDSTVSSSFDTNGQASGGASRGAWAVPGLVVLMIAGSRSLAATGDTPIPTTQSTSMPERSSRDQGGALESMRHRPKAVHTLDVSARSLPAARDVDQLLEKTWRTGEGHGLQIKSLRTAKVRREGGAKVQPVELRLLGTFPKVFGFLDTMRSQIQSAVPTSFEMVSEAADHEGARPLRVSITFDFHLLDDTAPPDAIVSAPTQPNVLQSLLDMANAMEGKIVLVGISFSTSDTLTGTTPRGYMKITGLAGNDKEVVGLKQRLSATGYADDVRLIKVEQAQANDGPARKFTLEFVVPSPEINPDRDGAVVRPTEPVREEVDNDRARALRAVQKLNVQMITLSDIRNKTCMINNLRCNVGDQIEGITVEDITPDGVIVRYGVYRFRLKTKASQARGR